MINMFYFVINAMNSSLLIAQSIIILCTTEVNEVHPSCNEMNYFDEPSVDFVV